MPRSHPQSRRRSQGGWSRTLLLAASVAALLAPSAAGAQALGLRGEVPENVTSNQSAAATDPAGKAGSDPARANPAAVLSNDTTAEQDDPTDTLGITPSSLDSDPLSQSGEPKPKKKGSKRFRAQADDEAAALPIKPKPVAGKAPQANRQLASKLDAETGAAIATAEPNAMEDGIKRGNQRVKSVDADEKQPLELREQPTGSIEGADGRKRDDTPFAALGIRAGSFVLRPALEEGITATSNADSSYDGKGAVLSETTLRLNAMSDWSEHSASADGYLTYRKTLSGHELEDMRGRLDGTLRLDLDHDLAATAKLGYEAAPESASSPVVIVDSVSQPLRQTIDGSLGLKKDAGKVQFGLTGAVKHDAYGDAELSTGGTLSQKDRDSTLVTATLRGGYEISPALTPFVELETGRRLYGQQVDASGYERSATRLGARVGTELDMGEKLAGEFSAGWLREAIDDDRLTPISGASVNADLKWSPERGTTVGLYAATAVEGTTTAAESGSMLYTGRLSLERQMRDNLTGNATLGADWRDYFGAEGHDLTLSAEASLTWWLSRYAGLVTRVRTEKLTSSLPGREQTTNSIFLGLRLQR